MTMTTTGTLIDGVVRLDELVDVPNNSRVTVTLGVIQYDPLKAKEALDRMLERNQDRPVHSGGVRYTREELHERD